MGKKLTYEQRQELAQYVEDRLDSRLRVTPWYDARGWDAVPITMVAGAVVATTLLIAGTVPLIIGEWQKVLG